VGAVMNNVHALELLCEAGRYAYDCENHAKKDEAAFAQTVEMFKQADTIIFNSMITNEEAMILQKLKKRNGYKLVNKEAKKFQEFLSSFGLYAGRRFYGGSLQKLEASDCVVVLGCCVRADNQKVYDSLKVAQSQRSAYIAYMHPLEDEALQDLVTQYIKYEVGSEEGLVAMLASLVVSEEGKEKYRSFFDALDIGYICGESSVGEEEFDEIHQKLLHHEKNVLLIGSDLFNHPRSKNIAKILGIISKYSDLEVLMIPSEANTLGVALICDLDDAPEGKTVGYRVKSDYTLSFLGDGDLDMPALTQQEGTFTSLDKRVVPFDAASTFDGYTLNDIANALGLEAEKTIDYTAKLPDLSGYKAVGFDDLENKGYELENADVKSGDEILEDIGDISEFNGTVVYRCNYPLTQFNSDANKAEQIESNLILLGSNQFASAAKIKAGTVVRFEMDGKAYQRKFKVSEGLKGTIAYNPVFDSTDNYDEYRYKRVKLEEVDE
jgi:NADH-quinone oxidoreductase subunit G